MLPRLRRRRRELGPYGYSPPRGRPSSKDRWAGTRRLAHAVADVLEPDLLEAEIARRAKELTGQAWGPQGAPLDAAGARALAELRVRKLRSEGWGVRAQALVQAYRFLDAFKGTIIGAIARGEVVEIDRFGKWVIRWRSYLRRSVERLADVPVKYRPGAPGQVVMVDQVVMAKNFLYRVPDRRGRVKLCYWHDNAKVWELDSSGRPSYGYLWAYGYRPSVRLIFHASFKRAIRRGGWRSAYAERIVQRMQDRRAIAAGRQRGAPASAAGVLGKWARMSKSTGMME